MRLDRPRGLDVRRLPVLKCQELPIQRGSAGTDPHTPKTGTERFDEAVAKVWPNPPVDDDKAPMR